MPDDLVPQIPVIRRVFEGFRVPVLIEPGMEADDVIATLARRGEERGLDVFICTADKDARQLITDHIRILNLRKKQVIDAAGPGEGLGHPPRPGRRLPGADRRLGRQRPRRARDRRGFAVHVPQGVRHARQPAGERRQGQGPKKQQSLREHAETARRARQLVALRDDLPLDLDWEALQNAGPERRGPQGPLHRVRLPPVPRRAGRPPSRAGEVDDLGWPTTTSSTRPSCSGDFLAELKRQPRFCIDTETTAHRPAPRRRWSASSFCWKAGEAYYLPVRGPIHCRVLDRDEALEALRPILADPAVEKVGQNIKYDMLVLGRAGVEIDGPITDTMVLSYLLESGERNHNLDQLSQRLLGHTMIPITDLIGKGKKQGTDGPGRGGPGRRVRRRGRRRDLADRGDPGPQGRAEGLWDALRRAGAAVDLGPGRGWRQAGVKVDVPRLRAALARVRRAAGDASRTRSTGWPAARSTSTPARSSAQVLFEELKLPSSQKTPGGEQSTAQEVLEELAAKHPLPRLAPAAPPALQAQEHLSRRPAGPGPPRRRPDPRLVQPERGGDRPAQLERPEPPEHPGPHRGGPADPPGVRGPATGLAAPDGRLLADRAADPGPLLGRPGPGPGLRARITTSTRAVAARIFGVAGVGRSTRRCGGWPRRSISA